MRRIFLIFMIALLPLRSWAGDIMAMDMTVQHLAAINIEANSAHDKRAGSSFDAPSTANPGTDCPGHTAMGTSPQSSAADPADTPADGHCSTCGVCQICHTVALANTSVGLASTFTAPTLLPLGSTRFTSALAAPSLKPPIS